MDQRQRRREGARRALESRARREQARQRRKTRRWYVTVGGVVGVLALIAIAGVVAATVGSSVGESVPQVAGAHREPYFYNTSPPTSGNHLPQLVFYGFTEAAVPPEAAVHNMEHGAVVIWFDPQNLAVVDDVQSLVGLLGHECLIATAYTDMTEEVVVTAWGRILRQDTYDEDLVLEFVDAYRGKRGPEAGFCRAES